MRYPIKHIVLLILSLFIAIPARAAVTYAPLLANQITGSLEPTSSNRVYASIGKFIERSPLLLDNDAEDYCAKVGCVDLDERLSIARTIRGLKDQNLWTNLFFLMSFSTNHQVSSGSTIYAIKGGNATLTGSPGRQSYGYTFDGTAGAWMSIPNPFLSMGNIPKMTCMMGLKAASGSAQCIIGGFRSSPNFGFMSSVHGSSTAGNQNNYLVADISQDGTTTLGQSAGRYLAKYSCTGNRQIACFTYGPTLLTQQGNADLRGTTSGTFTGIYNPAGTTTWEIARIFGATGFGLNGELAFIAVWAEQLTETQYASVRRLFEAEIGKRFLPKVNLVCEGDSLTEGGISTEIVFANQMATDSTWGPLINKRNIGKGGEGAPEVANEIPAELAPYAIDSRFGYKNILFLNIGINETLSKSGATIYNEVKGITARSMALGYTVVLTTMLPAQNGGSAPNNATIEAARTAYNTLVRGDPTICNYLCDIAAVANLQDPNNTTYFNADKIHLTTAGQTEVVNKFKATVPLPQ